MGGVRITADVSGITALVVPGDNSAGIYGEGVGFKALSGNEDGIPGGGGFLVNDGTVFFGDDEKINEEIYETTDDQIEQDPLPEWALAVGYARVHSLT